MADRFQRKQFGARARRSGPVAVVSVHGEVDLATGPRLEAVAKRAIGSPAPQTLLVDLDDCPFMDSTGLNFLLRTRTSFPGRMVVSCPPGGAVAQDAASDDARDRRRVRLRRRRAARRQRLTAGLSRPSASASSTSPSPSGSRRRSPARMRAFLLVLSSGGGDRRGACGDAGRHRRPRLAAVERDLNGRVQLVAVGVLRPPADLQRPGLLDLDRLRLRRRQLRPSARACSP